MPEFSTEIIRIVLIDQHALVRAGLRLLVESNPSFKVVGETGDCTEAVSIIAQQQPDLILCEIKNEPFCSVELISPLLDAATHARVLLVTDERDVEVHHQAARLGAMGVVLKDQTPEVLFKAITKVRAGEAWFDRATIASVLTQMTRGHQNNDPEAQKITSLSPREREVIALVGEGLKNQQIANRLSLSEITVRHHLTSIFAKLGVADRLELIIYAYQQNLAQLPR